MDGLEPDVLSLLICDQIITDRLTGKSSLIGLFSTVHATRFPATQSQLCVHMSMTDGRGKTPVTIRIVDSEEARPPIVEGKGIVDFKDPRAIANLSLQFYGLVFPAAGQYRVQLFADGTLLREGRLQLMEAKRRQGPGGSGGSGGSGGPPASGPPASGPPASGSPNSQ
jgi:hypothetical protein